MHIRLTDGTVFFESGCIGQVVTRTQFLNSALGGAADVLVHNEPYVTYRFRPEKGVAAVASFVGDRLSDISWLFELPPEKERVWSQEFEQERKQVHDEWLKEQLGMPPYTYAWGRIDSSFDPKGCVSDIILTYAS